MCVQSQCIAMMLLLEMQCFIYGFEAFRCPDCATPSIRVNRLASRQEFKYPNKIDGLKDV